MRLRRLSTTLLKPVVIILVLGLVVGLFYAIPRLGDAGTLVFYKGPSARVNGVKISDRDFNQVYLRYLQQYGTFLSEDQLRLNTMENLIGQELIKQEIKNRKIKVSDQEVEDLLAEIKYYYNISSEEEMEYLLYQWGVGSLKELKSILRESIAETKLYTVLGKEAQLEVDEKEIVERYEAVEPAHILIATNSAMAAEPLSDEEARQKAQDIYEQLQAGADFAELAREHSDGQYKEQGGNYGRIPLSYLDVAFPPEVAEAILQLEVGEYSAPIKTYLGYHLVMLLDKRLAQGDEWEQEKAKIRDDLIADRFRSEKRSEWLREQRTKHAKVEILDPYLLGYSLALEEKWKEATLAYEKATQDKRYKKDLKTFLALAEAYKEIEAYDAALGVFDRIPKNLQDNFQVYLGKADLYLAQGDLDNVKTVLATAEAKAGEDLTLLNQIRAKLEEAELTAEAEALAVKIADLEERNRQEQEELNRRLEEEQKKRQAEQEQEGIIEIPVE